jgi:ketosteroid isomerase-like protein
MIVTTQETTEIMRRFNDAFLRHEPAALGELVADDCVMESIQPAPDGTRYEGRAACLAFWQALAADRNSHFDVEDVSVAGDRAVLRWRYHYGEGQENSVRGVNLMLVRDGQIVEALGYAKVPAEQGPLTIE